MYIIKNMEKLPNCSKMVERIYESIEYTPDYDDNLIIDEMREKITCKGCTDGNICLFLKMQGKSCKTLDCVKEKDVDYCFECDTFPCENLMPLADGANKYPHNMKMYNLCMMKRIGVDAWSDIAGDIRKTYFTKNIVIGEGGSKE